MGTSFERSYTCHIVIASEHAGLRPYFKDLEAELYRVLARIDDPRDVRRYLETLRRSSQDCLTIMEAQRAQK